MPIRMTGMVSNLDTDAIIKELVSAQSAKKTQIEQKKEKASWTKEKWEEMNTKIYALYTEKLTGLKLQGSYLTKSVNSSNSEKVDASATTATNGAYSLTVNKLATAQFVTGAAITDKEVTKNTRLTEAGMSEGQTITLTVKDKEAEDGSRQTQFTVDGDMTVLDLISKLTEAGINASYDEDNGRFYLSAKASGSNSSFTLSSSDSGSTGLAALGLGNIDEELAASGQNAADATSMAVVAASDAELVLNGATLTSESNTVTANGLKLELKGTTSPGEVISITVSNDSQGVYDKIKDFVKSYNELLTEMYEKYNAASAKDYAMLTDEEKEAMTEDQVELWENKIKDSLLRRDNTLNSLISAFRNAMQKSVEIDGESFSLSSFGIVTGEYTENGILHIEGDEDDGLYAGKTDRLKTAIEANPEKVGKALSEIMGEFYNTLTTRMSATTISSALTFYNDKQIQSQMDSYEEQISDWERRLEDLEERYYKQFSGMERSLANLQSQQNQLAGLLGG